MSDVYEVLGDAIIRHGHSVSIVDIGQDNRIEIQRPDDGGKTLTLTVTQEECEALLYALMDAVG